MHFLSVCAWLYCIPLSLSPVQMCLLNLLQRWLCFQSVKCFPDTSGMEEFNSLTSMYRLDLLSTHTQQTLEAILVKIFLKCSGFHTQLMIFAVFLTQTLPTLVDLKQDMSQIMRSSSQTSG